MSVRKVSYLNLLLSDKKALYKQKNKISSNSNIFTHISGSPEFSFIANNNLSTILNNLNNNNLGTISNNASCFDFTSDFFSSLRQNEENISKAIDSFGSLSKQYTNKNAKSNNTIFNNYISNKNIKIDESKISNFSFENEFKQNQKYLSYKSLSNNNANKIVYNNKIKNKYIRKEIIKNIENYDLKRDSIFQNQFKKKEKNKKLNYIKITLLNDLNLRNENIAKNSIDKINKTFHEENKENHNSNKTLNFNKFKNYVNSDCSSDNFIKDLSEFTIAKVSKFINQKKNISQKKRRNSFARNNFKDKSFIKGEDIFKSKNTEILNTVSNRNCQNLFKSLDYNILRNNQCYKANQNSDNNGKIIKQRKSYVKRIFNS